MNVNALEAPIPNLWDFDLIVCNPPYIRHGDMAGLDPSVRDYEPALALDGGEDGLDFYRRISRDYAAHVNPGGALLMEVGAGQAADVAEMFPNARRIEDICCIERVVAVRG